MQRTYKFLLLALGLFISCAEASTYDIGSLAPSPVLLTITESPGRFTDTYNFSIDALSRAAVSVTNIPLAICDTKILNIRGLSMSLFDSADSLLMSGTRLSWLAQAGDYHIEITGKATGISGGAYALALSATPKPSPVPIPSALWMLFSGMIGLTAILYRRKT